MDDSIAEVLVLVPVRGITAKFDKTTNRLCLQALGNFDGYNNMDFKREDWYDRGLKYILQANKVSPSGVMSPIYAQYFINPKQPMPMPETITIITADSGDDGMEVPLLSISSGESG